MELLKSTASKVVTGLVALGVVMGGITWWQTPPETREALVTGLGRIAAWLGIVVVVPWAGVMVIAWVSKKDSNAWGAGLVAGMTLVEAVLLAWLLDWSISGAAAWTFFLLAVLIAGAYNLLVCDWLAERVG